VGEKNLSIVLFNKYTHLLIAFLVLFLAGPIVSKIDIQIQLLPCFFVVVIILALRAICLRRLIYYTCVFVVLVAFLLHGLVGSETFQYHKQTIMVLSNSIHAFFIFVSISFFILHVFSEKEVTFDTIQGGISIYLLIGIFWAFIYSINATTNSGAFDIDINENSTIFLFLYYSFTTLTTLGYGDMVPKSEWTMVLSTLEVLTGQIFLVVFIARLVGLHIIQHLRKTTDSK
jgi:hypothetical protein